MSAKPPDTKGLSGTIHAKRGWARITSQPPGTRFRLALLLLTAILGSALVVSVSRTTWERVDSLQREFGGLRADSFYLGVKLRGDIEHLNDILLRYRLGGDTNDFDLFVERARDLNQWLEVSGAHAHTPLERGFFKQVKSVYDDYRAESMDLLQVKRTNLLGFKDAGAFQKSYERAQKQSEQVFQVCDRFVAEQRTTFDGFLKESAATLADCQQLLKLSVTLVVTLVVALMMLVYRGMIAPLRLQLTESQAIIARQEKLASLGVLAAGVAHEIRNPLTAIKFRLFTLKKSLPDAGEDNEDAQVINNEINRLEHIVKDVLQFARPSDPHLVAIPARRILDEVCGLMKTPLEKNAIELKVDRCDAAWIRIDPQQIKQVLINLVQNSADSIGRDGVITLRARNGAASGRKPANGVVLEVTDTGKGIPPEVQQRLFDPFFTTKEGGTGLGLAISARIVEKNEGELYYQTEVNRGTTFSIAFARVTENET